ncbi:MAG: hypothetical protein LBH07_01870, partial [Treponema sp.]|nr:hypothetical protein [Treponema sp.]
MHIEKGWNGYRPVILPNIRARQERLFKAVNSMALLLLSLDENEENETKETVERSLKILGQSIYAGRSALWKNYPKDTGPYINRVANWNNPKLAEKLGYQVHDAIPRIFLIRTILPNWEIITGEPKPIITLAMDLPE